MIFLWIPCLTDNRHLTLSGVVVKGFRLRSLYLYSQPLPSYELSWVTWGQSLISRGLESDCKHQSCDNMGRGKYTENSYLRRHQTLAEWSFQLRSPDMKAKQLPFPQVSTNNLIILLLKKHIRFKFLLVGFEGYTKQLLTVPWPCLNIYKALSNAHGRQNAMF